MLSLSTSVQLVLNGSNREILNCQKLCCVLEGSQLSDLLFKKIKDHGGCFNRLRFKIMQTMRLLLLSIPLCLDPACPGGLCTELFDTVFVL